MEKRIGFIGFWQYRAGRRPRIDGQTGACAAERLCACAAHFDRLQKNAAALGVRAFERAEDVVSWSDFVVLAVKPYMVEAVLAPLRELLADKVLISVVSGYDFAAYEKLLSPKTRHISAIPNTPIAAGEGIMICEDRHSLRAKKWRTLRPSLAASPCSRACPRGCSPSPARSAAARPPIPPCIWKPLRRGRQARACPAPRPYRVAAKMLCGTGKLYLETGTHPGAMKDAVCSPGGTTIRGLAALERGGFPRRRPRRAIDAAEGKRSQRCKQRRPSAFLFC